MKPRWYMVDEHNCSVIQFRVKATSKKDAKERYRRFGIELNTDICRGRCIEPAFIILDPDQADPEVKS